MLISHLFPAGTNLNGLLQNHRLLKLNFSDGKKASSETVPNSFYSVVEYWCQPDQWK